MAEATKNCPSDATSCGGETSPSAAEDEARRQSVPVGNADEELWNAAKEADIEKVTECLEEHANVDWEKKSDEKGALEYKGWTMTSQALHVAALYGADETGDRKQKQEDKAARAVRLLLEKRADVNAVAKSIYEDKDTKAEMCRSVQAIHLAAGAGNTKVVKLLLDKGANKNAKALLQETVVDGPKKSQVLFSPIHNAVLYNHEECVKLLLGKEVDVESNEDGNTPLHWAANLGHVSIVELLLGLKGARKAFNDAVDQRTEMSLKAPRTGRLKTAVGLAMKAMKVQHIPVQFSDEKKKLLFKLNKRRKTALELATKGGRFPTEDIYWFATCLFATFESEEFTPPQEGKSASADQLKSATDLVEVFASVAAACPEVAGDLLKFADESGEASKRNCVDPRNLGMVRKVLAFDDEEAKKGVLKKFEELSMKSPHAAVVMLDALTTTPEEKYPLDDPLPRFFVPPRGDLYPLYCAYEDDQTWDFKPKDGVKEWHKKLARGAGDWKVRAKFYKVIVESYGATVKFLEWLVNIHRDGVKDKHKELAVDAGDGKEEEAAEEVVVTPARATVQVVNLQGFANPRVLNILTRQTEDCLFTKLAVHALLKFTWDSMKALFILDMIYEFAAIVIISRWIVTSADQTIFTSELLSDFVGRVAWCIVAGQASQEAVILAMTGIRHQYELSHGDTMNWACRNLHRICLSIMTIGLARATQEEHWPSEDAVISAALGATSFCHWLTMLYKVRAFVKTGTRLVPIMKAMLPIGGMLVILGFLMVGFMHVFWAMDRNHADEVNTWQFITFLFIADNFINDESLGEMSQGRQYLMMVLGGISLFIFTSCSMNLFIAVLGEVYEQEQERMPITFLKERACVCSFLIMRPEIPMPQRLKTVMPGSGRQLSLWIFFACVATVSLVVACCMLLKISSWPGALTFAFWAVLQQALMKHALTEGWDSKCIWYCADGSAFEEIFALGRSREDHMLPQSSAWKLKRYITEIMSLLKSQDEKIIAASDSQIADLKRLEDAQKETQRAEFKRLADTQKALDEKLDRALAALGAEQASSTAEVAPPAESQHDAAAAPSAAGKKKKGQKRAGAAT